MENVTTVELTTDQERIVVGSVLAILRAGWDRCEVNSHEDLREVYRDGSQYPIGIRAMGATLTVHGICDRARDLQSGETMAGRR